MANWLGRFVGLGEDPQVLAIRAPALFSVSNRVVFRDMSNIFSLCR